MSQSIGTVTAATPLSASPRRVAAATAGGTRADVRGDAAATGGRGPPCHGSRAVCPQRATWCSAVPSPNVV